MNIFRKTAQDVQMESLEAKQKMSEILASDVKCFVFSYEAFIFLRKDYLSLLYKFLDVESDFMPLLKDGNKKYLRRPLTYFEREIEGLKRRLRKVIKW